MPFGLGGAFSFREVSLGSEGASCLRGRRLLVQGGISRLRERLLAQWAPLRPKGASRLRGWLRTRLWADKGAESLAAPSPGCAPDSRVLTICQQRYGTVEGRRGSRIADRGEGDTLPRGRYFRPRGAPKPIKWASNAIAGRLFSHPWGKRQFLDLADLHFGHQVIWV